MQRKTKQTAQRKNVIEDKAKRINLKSKRTRTLLRKAIEVSQMCELDIHIALWDRSMNKLVEYGSTAADGQFFSFDRLRQVAESFRNVTSSRFYKLYTDLDYDNLKTQPRGSDGLDEEQVERLPVEVRDLTTSNSLTTRMNSSELVKIDMAQFERVNCERGGK